MPKQVTIQGQFYNRETNYEYQFNLAYFTSHFTFDLLSFHVGVLSFMKYINNKRKTKEKSKCEYFAVSVIFFVLLNSSCSSR